MAVNDKLYFDVLFRNVDLLPCSYSLERQQSTTIYDNNLGRRGYLNILSTEKLLYVFLNIKTEDN